MCANVAYLCISYIFWGHFEQFRDKNKQYCYNFVTSSQNRYIGMAGRREPT